MRVFKSRVCNSVMVCACSSSETLNQAPSPCSRPRDFCAVKTSLTSYSVAMYGGSSDASPSPATKTRHGTAFYWLEAAFRLSIYGERGGDRWFKRLGAKTFHLQGGPYNIDSSRWFEPILSSTDVVYAFTHKMQHHLTESGRLRRYFLCEEVYQQHQAKSFFGHRLMNFASRVCDIHEATSNLSLTDESFAFKASLHQIELAASQYMSDMDQTWQVVASPRPRSCIGSCESNHLRSR